MLSKEVRWGIIGLAVTLVTFGLGLLLSVASTGGRAVGTAATVAGFLLAIGLVWRASYLSSRQRFADDSLAIVSRLETSTTSILSKFDEGVSALEDTFAKINAQNDARFLPQGFIGLQRASLRLDEDREVGNERVRMAVLGHLPSYMRMNELSMELGAKLYENWEPPHLVRDYVNLVNRRSIGLRNFLEDGGVVREIYDRASLTKYVDTGSTFHDKVEDPAQEMIERLSAILSYLNRHNYMICLLDSEEERLGPHFLLKQGVGLVLDLRTTETHKHFTRSLDGLYSDSPKALEAFEEKFTLMWGQTKREEAIVFISGLIGQLSARSR